jgi:hypothetical protein
MRSSFSSLLAAATLALALTFTAGDAEAQQRGKKADRDARNRGSVEEVVRPRPELQRRDASRARGVPPGWCIGRGNPHNTPENCGYRSTVDRRDDRRHTAGRSFEEAHAIFHREHDRRCRARAAERPLDVQWQVRVRADCRAEHDRWHARHDPNWQ